MPEPRDDITFRFPLLGLELSRATGGIKSYSLDSDFTTPTDAWSVEIFSPDGVQFGALFDLQPVEILVNGTPQLVGRVDGTDIGSAEGNAMSLAGRDYLADLVECHADPSLAIGKDMTLSAALLLACGPVGISEVVDNADVSLQNVRAGVTVSSPTGRTFKELKVGDMKPNPGQGLFDWGSKLVERQGATIQPGLQRSQIVLAAPNYDQEPSFGIFRRENNPEAKRNNVIHARAVTDYSSFPTYVLALGRQPGGDGESTPAAVASGLVAGEVSPEDLAQFAARFPPSFADGELIHSGRIRPTDAPKSGASLYRFHCVRDEDSRSGAELARMRLRHAADRLKETLSYEVELRGHADPKTGAVYAVDTVVDVDDAICGVRERLWVASRTFEYSSNGPTTRLRCYRLGAYVI